MAEPAERDLLEAALQRELQLTEENAALRVQIAKLTMSGNATAQLPGLTGGGPPAPPSPTRNATLPSATAQAPTPATPVTPHTSSATTATAPLSPPATQPASSPPPATAAAATPAPPALTAPPAAMPALAPIDIDSLSLPSTFMDADIPELRVCSLASIRAGAEARNLQLLLCVLVPEEDDTGVPMPGNVVGGHVMRVAYVSPSYRSLVGCADEQKAIRVIEEKMAVVPGVRFLLYAPLKSMLFGDRVSPSLLQNVVYKPSRIAELMLRWTTPVSVLREGVSDLKNTGAGRVCDTNPAGGGGGLVYPEQRLLGIISCVAWNAPEHGSYSQETLEGLIRDHMTLRYLSNLVAITETDGTLVSQNPVSAMALGVLGYEHLPPDAPRFNYLQALLAEVPGWQAEVAAVVSKAQSWHRTVCVSRHPLLQRLMEVPEGQERWHEVQISGVRDPLHQRMVYVVAETDVSTTIAAQSAVSTLQRQQQSLLKQILPQQVIDKLLEPTLVEGGVPTTPKQRLGSADEPARPQTPRRRTTRQSSWGHLPVVVDARMALDAVLEAEEAGGGGEDGAAELGECASDLECGPGGDSDDAGTQHSGHGDDTVRLSHLDITSLATYHEQVTVFFADVKGFTALSQQLHPSEVMLFLNVLYTTFDSLVDAADVYKVETIGDCYMVCGGLFATPGPNGQRLLGGVDPNHAAKVFRFARQMVAVTKRLKDPLGEPVQMRVGIHSGMVMSGVVGRRMPRFCLFGDTVNTASRMETTGAPGRIHVSETTQRLLAAADPSLKWEATGGVFCKGKGTVQSYFWAGEGDA